MASNQEQQLGNYRVLRLLGRGGFADVYLGQHLYLKSYAALKVLRTSLEDEDVTQFMTEAQTLARLVHPQIVRVLDFDVLQGSPMLIMEYSPGGTLRQRHPRGECLSLETTVAYIKQVAAALHYAHAHDVIHRDVKPENMLLGDQQVVRLSDFGLALLAPSPEQLSTQGMSGTIPYMAPEQLHGKPRQASDQYALGVVAYEWLCGVRPFEGTYWQLAYQHVSVPPLPLREKDPSLPESVEAVVLKALAKDPQQRYGSVQLFAQALEEAVQAEAGSLREVFEVTAPLRAVSPAIPVTPATTPRKVFLSAFSSDAPFVARLSADLQARGITLWNAHLEVTQPENGARDRVRQAMRAVDALLMVVAPGMQSSRLVKQHLQLAGLYRRPIIYLQMSSDETIETLPLVEHISIIEAHPADYAAALEEIVRCIEHEQAITSNEEGAPSAAEHTPRNPYKGLRAFQADDAQDFFGRDALITELSDQLQAMLSTQPTESVRGRLLAVVGPSGSGKSSVVMAGLLPRLAGGALPASNQWVYLEPVIPGVHPIEALALTLAPQLPQRSVKSIREDLEDDTARGLHTLSTQLVKASDQKVVLLVDQFEELFTLTSDEAERQQFIDLLVTAATEPRGPLVVILTLRADFYDRPIAYPELGRLILRHQCLVSPMQVHELRAAVRQPAALPDVQLSFEGNLIGDLLYEVQGQPGALPLLQFTLDQLFQRRSDLMLTSKVYQEIGGLKGALAKHAEATYSELPTDQHRRLARALFLRLIDPGFTEQDTTRRRVSLGEVTLAAPEENELLQQVIAYLLAARLLTTSVIAGTSTVEVSHEALIREWPRLADWLWEARDDVRLQQALSKDAAEWEQRGLPGDRLYRGSQLKEARAWTKRNLPSKQEAAFLQRSAARQRRSLIAVVAVILVVLTTSGIAGWFYLNRAHAPNYVTTTNENAIGSLRWAIGTAHPGDTITFDPSIVGQIIILKNADIHIFQQNLTIRGPATGHITIREIRAGLVIDTLASVTISGVVFQGSNEKDQPQLILNQGKLTLINCALSGNTPSNSGGGLYTGGGIYNAGTLTITDSTISGNTSDSNGGGIFNNGTLTITDSTISRNSAPNSGGGIYSGGILSISNSTISGNTSDSDSGGISNNGTLSISNSTISGNTAGSDGGGIFNNGTLTITGSAISGNTASGRHIGTIYNGGGGINNVGTLSITSSTISGNTASGYGGGIFDQNFQHITLNYDGGILSITNSTISDNTASASDNTASARGGGIYIRGGFDNTSTYKPSIPIQVDLTFSTIYGNTGHDGGEMAVEDYTIDSSGNSKAIKQVSQVKVRNSIAAGNSAHPGPDISGTLLSYGYNLFQDNSGATFDPSTAAQQRNDKQLSVSDLSRLFASPTRLRNNGGATLTYALAPGSPAIDAIPLQYCQLKDIIDSQSKKYTDQRGFPRPNENDGACDIGAYEYAG